MTEETKPIPTGNISVGDIKQSKGVAVGHQARATVTETNTAGVDDMAQAFAAILEKVQVLPEGPAKEDAAEAVKKLEAEARQGEQADEGRVRRWLEFLAETAPDAWEVAVNTFISPVAGLGTVFKKIAERAKAAKEAGAQP